MTAGCSLGFEQKRFRNYAMILKQLDGTARSIREHTPPAEPRNDVTDVTTEVPIGIRNNFRLGPPGGNSTGILVYPAR